MGKFFEKYHGRIWLMLILSVLLIFDICVHIDVNFLSENTIIVGFIGILASIIVIGNLTQVYSIKNDFDKKVDDINETMARLDEFNTTIAKSVNEMYEQYSKSKTKTSVKSKNSSNE